MVEFGNTEGLPLIGVDDDVVKHRRDLRKQRSGEAMESKWREDDVAELELAERLMAPPMIVEPRCHVCAGPFAQWRFYVERMLLKGYPLKAIAEQIPADPVSGKKLHWKSIKNHKASHMPLDQAVIRTIMEEEAELIQQNHEESVRGAFTMRAALEIMVRKGFQMAMDSITTIEPRDLIQMMKLYDDMNTDSGTAAMEEAKAVVRIYSDAIREVLTHEDYVDLDTGDRIMRAIASTVNIMKEAEEMKNTIDSTLRLPTRSEVITDAEVVSS